ncbi:hypothetical protein ACLB2K_007506 [Fragaria x ananassa]
MDILSTELLKSLKALDYAVVAYATSGLKHAATFHRQRQKPEGHQWDFSDDARFPRHRRLEGGSAVERVFVGSRLNVTGAWQMPQGGIKDGEEPKSAAIWELREETGVVSVEIIAEVPNWLAYDFPACREDQS